jgi:hypothetical protein
VLTGWCMVEEGDIGVFGPAIRVILSEGGRGSRRCGVLRDMIEQGSSSKRSAVEDEQTTGAAVQPKASSNNRMVKMLSGLE